MLTRRLGVLLLLGIVACPQTPPPAQKPKPTPAALPSASACERSQKSEPEAIYTAPLTPNAEPFDAKNVCAVTQGGLQATGDAVLRSDLRPALPLRRWDHKSQPARLGAIDRRFALTGEERDRLMRDGFVVSARLDDVDYVTALHEVFQSQLPLYVSADAVLHAIYASSDKLLAELEATLLAPRLDRLLESLHCALPEAAKGLPSAIARDVDLYLAVARTLLAAKGVASLYGQESEVSKLVGKVKAAEELAEISIFGRKRMVDFSLYRPRGHYAADLAEQNPGHTDLSAYFRAAMWLSRLEWNLVSRSCRSSERGPDASPTPHEAAVAIAMGRLITAAKGEEDLAALDRAWGLLAGKREDVPLPKLAVLAAGAGINSLDDPELSAKLRKAIGADYVRTARTHYTWEGCKDLPVIATMLGPRVVADAASTRPLVHGETLERHMLHAADMAYALGHDRALTYLAADLAKYPALRQNLDKARVVMNGRQGPDLYSAWSAAIGKLAAPGPAGAALPSFMQTAAFADLRVNSAVAAFGQLRHNYVLLAAQTYDEGGCAIPDGFIEPVPAVYDALVAYAERGAATLRSIDPEDASAAQSYFARLGRTLQILAKIARDELANRPLTEEEKRFLSMVVEVTGQGRGTGGSPTFTGWYFDLFRDRRDAFSGAAFIADYYSSSELGAAAYVGVSGVRLGVFVVDVAGEPRAFVGPVARAYEHVGPLAPRLTDADAARLPASERSEPWASSYTVPAGVEPPLTFLATATGTADAQHTQEVTLEVFSSRPLGPVTIELLDHHRIPLGRVTHSVGLAKTRYSFPSRPMPKGSEHFGYEGVHVHVNENGKVFDAWELDARADAQSGALRTAIATGYGRAYGGMPALPPPPPSPPEL